MMKKVFMLSLAAILSTAHTSASAQEIREGEVIPLTDFSDTRSKPEEKADRVIVKNPSPISNNKTVFNFGEDCSRRSIGKAMVVGTIDQNLLLMRYSISRIEEGMSCPDQTLFYMSKEEFLRRKVAYERARAVEEREKEVVRNLLNKKK